MMWDVPLPHLPAPLIFLFLFWSKNNSHCLLCWFRQMNECFCFSPPPQIL